MNALTQAAFLLGLPLFEQEADGVLHVNDAARALLGAALPGDFAKAVARAAGCAEDDARLVRVLATARTGRAASAVIDGARVAAIQSTTGGICAVLVPGSSDLERRAALVDAAAEVTHEVSNALSAIAGWAEIARDDAARVSEALDRIDASARSAREAARGLLGAARGVRPAAGSAAPNTDAAALAVDVARTLAPLAASRGARIETIVAGPALVDDPLGKLWTVLWNLAKNGIEAANRGGFVELRVTSLPRSVRITVSDDGPGMDVAAREQAFTAYFTTKRGGTGLGLGLVKNAVESLQGAISLEARDGGGLRATVTLPIAEPAADAGEPRPRAASVRPPGSSKGAGRNRPARTRGASGPRDSGVRSREVLVGQRVVIVEDDVALRELLATTLGLRGARVTALASGAAARALEDHFDLAIIDLTLGDVRGDAVLADLRARGVLRGPAVMATGRELPESLDAEPDAVLRKPFAIDEMTDLLTDLAERPRNASARPR